MPASSERASALGRIGGAIAIVLNVIGVVSSAAVVGLMFFLVVARYVLGLSVVGLHELIMLAAVALYMVGAVIASRRHEHLTVDWIAGSLKNPRGKAAHDLLIATLTIVVTCFFMVWAYHMFTWGMKRPQSTPAFQIPLWIPQFAIGVAAVGCYAYALRDAIDACRRLMRR
ncbi:MULTISPECIES: TRAP transporter small permease [Roseovarius]|uniref:TRAP transporter small permease n=1 Tax=Roseovarius TaxID=74030 RepID=UPI001C9794B1|nr:TRAP transporter small permease [Roseovarius atlanticus]MBY5989907.1 TRAP transporter small permease [Roseovarius atlanticus]MBY6126452.1 TRAP transporter small permease [Roseovarius atlanticus]MBY6150946.1 TRAP transporter small permease [Roseovarius atlanticus]